MSEIIGEVRQDIEEQYTKFFEDFGMSPTLIKIYMSLFFSKEPLGLSEISQDTGYSNSTICQTVDMLVRYTDIRKFKKPGSKKIYYECTHDIKKAVRKKMGGQREMIQTLIRVLKESEEKLDDSKDDDADRMKGHIIKLRKDYEKMDKVFALLMTMQIIGKEDEA